MFGESPENPFQSWYTLGVRIALDLLLIVVASAAQSIAFSRMGKEIDKPLWKIGGDLEALKRYFGLWFVLNFMAISFNEAANYFLLADRQDIGGMFFLLFCLVNTVYIPIGACIMFHGRFDRGQLAEHLKPLFRQVAMAFAIFMFSAGIVILFIVLVAQTQAQPWMLPIINVVIAYFDCVVFAATWLLCMHDRMHPEEVELDF
jgi:hypothetical protein